MKCPFCGFDESKVVDSRSTDDNTTIRRRRECANCSKRYTTYEKIEDIPILVIKRDSTRENFNKEKIVNGLIIACQKMQPKPDGFDDESDILEREFNDEPPFIDIKLDMGSIYKFIKSFQSNLCGILVINHGEKDSHAIAMVGIPNTENAFSYMYDPNIGVIFVPPRGIVLAFHCIQSMYTVNSMIFYDLS